MWRSIRIASTTDRHLDLAGRKFKVIFTKSSFHFKCCVYVFNMLYLKFAGNVINMQFSPIKLPLIHDPKNVTRLHTYSHMKIIGGGGGGCVQTSKMLDNNIICCFH